MLVPRTSYVKGLLVRTVYLSRTIGHRFWRTLLIASYVSVLSYFHRPKLRKSSSSKAEPAITYNRKFYSKYLKVARYSFSRPILNKFEHKLRRHKQSFGKIAPTVVLDKDENLLWSGLQWHRSCHSNEMTLLPILLTKVFLDTENCSSKIIHESFFLQ